MEEQKKLKSPILAIWRMLQEANRKRGLLKEAKKNTALQEGKK